MRDAQPARQQRAQTYSFITGPNTAFNLAKHNVKSFTHIFNKESKYAAAIPLQKRIFAPGKPIHGNVRQSFDTKSRRKLQMPPLRCKRKSIIRSLSNALRQNTQRLF